MRSGSCADRAVIKASRAPLCWGSALTNGVDFATDSGRIHGDPGLKGGPCATRGQAKSGGYMGLIGAI